MPPVLLIATVYVLTSRVTRILVGIIFRAVACIIAVLVTLALAGRLSRPNVHASPRAAAAHHSSARPHASAWR